MEERREATTIIGGLIDPVAGGRLRQGMRRRRRRETVTAKIKTTIVRVLKAGSRNLDVVRKKLMTIQTDNEDDVVQDPHERDIHHQLQ